MEESLDIKKLHENPPYGVIAILFIGAFVAILNNTLLNIALPVIMEEFAIRPSDVQWLTTGFMLVNGILIPASAFFIQKFTNKKIFLTAMILFSLGTFLAIIAPTFNLLIVSRMIQACGSALMMPLLMNVMLTAFPIEKRGTALGMFGLVMFTAPAIGPTLSGWVVEHYSWHMLFVIVLPISLLTIVIAIFKMKNITPNRDVKLDFLSLVLSSIGFGGLLYGFSTAGEKGWGAIEVYSTIAIGTLALIIFVVKQLNMKEPMLDFKIYKHPMFALASAISIVLSIAMFSGMILTPLYVQSVRGISPLHAGLLLLPGAIIMGVMSPITGKLFDKYGPRALAYTGLTITAVSTFYLSRLEIDTGYYYLMMIYTIRMFGLSMVTMPIMTNGMNSLPMKSNPHGTAMNNTLQQVSGAIGSALLLTIMTNRLEKSAAAQANELAASGVDITSMTEEIKRMAMLDGVNHAFFISTLITVGALVLSLFIKRVVPPTFTPVKNED
ncbi:MFS transporter [Sporosarcina sp. P13]|uniref:DHA2 family efflux MFS transporter permease subunit n=1 Tax=Sporosarcina sp. P13 TaxID=2048263 RepID=UPI000C171971|nr:DHA2 family efflux MFS transporter permease subunit [Sporosarcina sp. P13]PIC64774.1 MFS transporter [Sporosarcina sp. P13]